MPTARIRVDRGAPLLPQLGPGDEIVCRRPTSRAALADAIVAVCSAGGLSLQDLVADLSARIPAPAPAEPEAALVPADPVPFQVLADRPGAMNLPPWKLAGFGTADEWHAAGSPDVRAHPAGGLATTPWRHAGYGTESDWLTAGKPQHAEWLALAAGSEPATSG